MWCGVGLYLMLSHGISCHLIFRYTHLMVRSCDESVWCCRLDIIGLVATCIYDHLCVMPKQINIVLLFKSKHMCFRVFSLWIHHHLPTCKRQATHRTILMPLAIDTSGPQKLSPKQWTCIRYTKDTWMLMLLGPETTQDAGCESSAENYLHPQTRKFKQQGQKESDEQTRRDETNISI